MNKLLNTKELCKFKDWSTSLTIEEDNIVIDWLLDNPGKFMVDYYKEIILKITNNIPDLKVDNKEDIQIYKEEKEPVKTDLNKESEIEETTGIFAFM